MDVLIIGGGPAGLSAAINVAAKGGTCTVLSNPLRENPLFRTPQIDNYSGMAGVSGENLLTRMRREAEQCGTRFVEGHVTAIMPYNGTFAASVQNDIVQGKRLILAIGAHLEPTFDNESTYIGRGISYCATCDGRLYAGRKVLVTGNAADLDEEADFLRRVGCDVTVISKKEREQAVVAKNIRLWEEDGRLCGLTADGTDYAADAVFILRQVIAPTLLLPHLETENGFIKVDRQMRTAIEGCYAAGDCTGRPLQIAKAVGEGLIAAQEAMNSIQNKAKG